MTLPLLIIILLAIATFHFVYEGIVAPSVRMQLRNKLFCLRDELRQLKVDGQLAKADAEAFWYVHDGISSFLNRLPYLTIGLQISVDKAYRENPALQARIEQRCRLLNSCQNKVITDVFAKTTRVVEEAFIVNSGGWFVYIVPLGILIATLGSLKKLAFSLVLTPEPDTQKMMPQGA